MRSFVLIALLQSLKGGVTIVQVREKNIDTGEVRCNHGLQSTSLTSLLSVRGGGKKDETDHGQGEFSTIHSFAVANGRPLPN
jgi:hypothetical protein